MSLNFREEGQSGNLNFGSINLIMSFTAIGPEEIIRGVNIDKNEKKFKGVPWGTPRLKWSEE